MESHKVINVNKFRIPTTKHFWKGESVKLSKQGCGVGSLIIRLQLREISIIRLRPSAVLVT